MTQLSHSKSEENVKKIFKEISAAIRAGNCVLLMGLGFSLFIQTDTNENQPPQVYLRELLNRIFNWCTEKEHIAPQATDHKFEGLQGLLRQGSLVLAARQI